MTDYPLISVVVATYNRAALLPRLIDSLGRQSIRVPFEIVVVDDGSSDATWTELQRLADLAPTTLRPMRQERNAGPATARNRGWREARAQVVAFTDDDCMPDEHWLEALWCSMRTADVVQGMTVPDPEQVDRSNAFTRTLHVTNESGFYETANIAYRRSVLEQLGGFDETFRLPSGEDTDLGWRARDGGFTMVFEPTAVVRHDVHPTDFATFLRYMLRWDGVVKTVRLHPELRSKFHPGPFWARASSRAATAFLGLAVTATAKPSRSRARSVLGLALFVPYVHHRLVVEPMAPSRGARVRLLPACFVADLLAATVVVKAQLVDWSGSGRR